MNTNFDFRRGPKNRSARKRTLNWRAFSLCGEPMSTQASKGPGNATMADDYSPAGEPLSLRPSDTWLQHSHPEPSTAGRCSGRPTRLVVSGAVPKIGQHARDAEIWLGHFSVWGNQCHARPAKGGNATMADDFYPRGLFFEAQVVIPWLQHSHPEAFNCKQGAAGRPHAVLKIFSGGGARRGPAFPGGGGDRWARHPAVYYRGGRMPGPSRKGQAPPATGAI